MEPINNAVNYMVDYNGGKVSYIKYVWDIVANKRETILDTFGEYEPGIPNEAIDVHTKLFLWLESIINDDYSREAMIMTSSELCVEEVEEVVNKYKESVVYDGFDPAQLYEELYDTMFDFLDGC